MAIEIERKFLVRNDDWRLLADRGVCIRQGYLTQTEAASVRIRVQGDQANINIKSATLAMTRQEFEYPIPLQDAQAMLLLARQPLIEKTRYHIDQAPHKWEIDEFHGENAGLIVAEIELNDTQESFHHPSWLGEEVTDDPRYYNVCLVEHPYSQWSD